MNAIAKNILICLIATFISVVLCTLGFRISSIPIANIATIWPAAITQSVVSALFGGWGVLATVLGGIVEGTLNGKHTWVVIGFIFPNFVQSFIPAFYYRRVIRRRTWGCTFC